MRLFMACLIIYGLDLHWMLYVIALAIVAWQWGSPLVMAYIEESARRELGKRLEPTREAVIANSGNMEFLSWRTDRPSQRWVADIDEIVTSHPAHQYQSELSRSPVFVPAEKQAPPHLSGLTP